MLEKLYEFEDRSYEIWRQFRNKYIYKVDVDELRRNKIPDFAKFMKALDHMDDPEKREFCINYRKTWYRVMRINAVIRFIKGLFATAIVYLFVIFCLYLGVWLA